jgi:hypothetical protein
VVVEVAAGRVTAVSWVVVVVEAAGSFTTVVQELRVRAKAGTMQMSVSFFIYQVVTLMVDSLQVPFSDVLKAILFDSFRPIPLMPGLRHPPG